MSSSEPKSKIDFLDSAADTKKKISTAFCEEGNVEENGVLSFFKAVAVPISELRLKVSEGKESPFVSLDAPAGTVITLNRDEKYGGNLHFNSYQSMESEFAEKKLHPKDLKSGMVRPLPSIATRFPYVRSADSTYSVCDASIQVDIVNILLQPIRDAFAQSEAFRKSDADAYPVEKPAAQEKKVKVRNLLGLLHVL